MFPSICAGDELSIDLFTQPKKVSELSEGQVVLLKCHGEWVAHRVVRYQGQLLTKGDWALLPDDKEVQAWGVVERVNGRRGSWIDSSFLAKLSQRDLRYPHPLFRKIRKAFFFFVVLFMKSKNFRRLNV